MTFQYSRKDVPHTCCICQQLSCWKHQFLKKKNIIIFMSTYFSYFHQNFVKVIWKHVSVHTIKAYTGTICIAPLILNISTRLKCMADFMHPQFYTGKEPGYPLNRWLGGAQRWSGHFEELQIIQPALYYIWQKSDNGEINYVTKIKICLFDNLTKRNQLL